MYKYGYQFMRPQNISSQTVYFSFYKSMKPFLWRMFYVTAQYIKPMSPSCYRLTEVGRRCSVITHDQFCGVIWAFSWLLYHWTKLLLLQAILWTKQYLLIKFFSNLNLEGLVSVVYDQGSQSFHKTSLHVCNLSGAIRGTKISSSCLHGAACLMEETDRKATSRHRGEVQWSRCAEGAWQHTVLTGSSSGPMGGSWQASKRKWCMNFTLKNEWELAHGGMWGRDK